MSEKKFSFVARVAVLSLMLPLSVQADWSETFDYTLGALSGQGGWVGGSHTVTTPPLDATGGKASASVNSRSTAPLDQVYGDEDELVWLTFLMQMDGHASSRWTNIELRNGDASGGDGDRTYVIGLVRGRAGASDTEFAHLAIASGDVGGGGAATAIIGNFDSSIHSFKVKFHFLGGVATIDAWVDPPGGTDFSLPSNRLTVNGLTFDHLALATFVGTTAAHIDDIGITRTALGPPVVDGVPELVSGWASRRTATSAKLWAQIHDDHNEPAFYWFCYWPNKPDADAKDSLIGWPGRTGKNAAMTVTGLDPNTLYFFQAKASNSEGVGKAENYGAFWTKTGTIIDWRGPLPLAPPEVVGPVVSAVNVGGGDLMAADINFRSDMAHMGTPHKALTNIDQLLKKRFTFSASDMASSGDESFDAVLQTCRLPERVRASRTLWVHHLIPGAKYRIQLYSFDPRTGHASEGAAYYYEDELGHGSESYTRGAVSSMIGEFTATCRTHAIFWHHVEDTVNDPVMNAIVLSLLPNPLKESFAYDAGGSLEGLGLWQGGAFAPTEPGLTHDGVPGATGNKATAGSNGRTATPLDQKYGDEDETVFLSFLMQLDTEASSRWTNIELRNGDLSTGDPARTYVIGLLRGRGGISDTSFGHGFSTDGDWSPAGVTTTPIGDFNPETNLFVTKFSFSGGVCTMDAWLNPDASTDFDSPSNRLTETGLTFDFLSMANFVGGSPANIDEITVGPFEDLQLFGGL